MQRRVTSLLTIKQQLGETLREYVKRFIVANSKVIDHNGKFSLSAFKEGLSNETISLVLTSVNVTTLSKTIKVVQKSQKMRR